MGSRRKRRGHFCWCCGRIRANERFSGRGHARHLCRECSKLGKDELDYRQALCDIDRMVDWSGVIRKKHRKSFEVLLSHPDERVRRYARKVAVDDLEAREAVRQDLGLEGVEDPGDSEDDPDSAGAP